jgi:hypothetical protein
MPTYWIQAFNLAPIGNLLDGDLITALRAANYNSLCKQYRLEQELIAPALKHLKLLSGPTDVAAFSVLKYQTGDRAPLIIYHWDAQKSEGRDWLGETLNKLDQSHLRDRLKDTREILGVTLQAEQLRDFGLVLAYEVARWAAFMGQGLIYGVDGTWYRLNRHQAFIPMEEAARG